MNSKELISELANRLNGTQKDATRLLDATVAVMKEEFAKSNTVSFQGFGAFEVRKKEERISVNPATQKRVLTPPKLVLAFKASATLKDKLKELPEHE